jgi:sugar-specific transcriptional regulator TrmB
MSIDNERAEVLSLLQDLGLKEYESRCFLALTGLQAATAREISERSEVPRTRVYDAVRVLEAKGLVEVQHSSPQRFRAVGVEEATETLRQRYDERIDDLGEKMSSLDPPEAPSDPGPVQEVWGLRGHEAISSRTLEELEAADSEMLLVVVEPALLTDGVLERLQAATDRGVDVSVGGNDEATVQRLRGALPDADVFRTELDWLVGPPSADEVAISRLLLVDGSSLLVSSYYPKEQEHVEQAVVASGLDNGVVVLIRRLVSTGLLPPEITAND